VTGFEKEGIFIISRYELIEFEHQGVVDIHNVKQRGLPDNISTP